MYYQVLMYVNTSKVGHVNITYTYVYEYFATKISRVFCLTCAIYKCIIILFNSIMIVLPV